jgi:hypothetical protein
MLYNEVFLITSIITPALRFTPQHNFRRYRLTVTNIGVSRSNNIYKMSVIGVTNVTVNLLNAQIIYLVTVVELNYLKISI